MNDGALYHLIYLIIKMDWDFYTIQALQGATENEVKHAQTYIFHACMHTNTQTHTSGPASRRELRPLSQSGVRGT